MMLILPLLLLQAAESVSTLPSVQLPEAQDEFADAMVTVTGRSLRSTAASLKECLARHCPPGEDIAASMEHAENQLIAGDIEDARTTLIKSRSRNKRYAESLPREVSGLLQFDADVASLLGLADYGRIATFDSVDALKAGLPADDPAISIKRLEVADVFLRQENIPPPFTCMMLWRGVPRSRDGRKFRDRPCCGRCASMPWPPASIRHTAAKVAVVTRRSAR
ncbi:MAG: hypothetical protein J7530_00035 [Novosphingobium sp.]|nr:hypothetical protein [Novosphingobium sp.]